MMDTNREHIQIMKACYEKLYSYVRATIFMPKLALILMVFVIF